MDITWLGHACVRVRTRQAAVVMDPAAKSAGFDMGRPTADIVTVSRHHPHHDHVGGVRGQPVILDGPGEYEIQGVQVYGLSSPLQAEGDSREPNTAFLLEAEGLHVAHLGGGSVPPGAEDAEVLTNADILIVAIDDEEPVDTQQAARAVRDLEPAIVIPVSYPGPTSQEAGSALRAFLDATGLSASEPEAKLSVNRRQLGEETRVVLLEPSKAS